MARFTPEELAELAAFDAEVDETFEITSQEAREADRRDVFLDEGGDPAKRKRLEYRMANREKINAYYREYFKRNQAQKLAAQRKWYAKHKDYAREKKAEWYRKNRAEISRQEAERQNIYRPYGQMIAQARTARGWSQEKLGEAMGIKGNSVSRYERGTRAIDWERFRTVMPELGPRPEGFPGK